jgi:Zn-dependent metalloprotease
VRSFAAKDASAELERNWRESCRSFQLIFDYQIVEGARSRRSLNLKEAIMLEKSKVLSMGTSAISLGAILLFTQSGAAPLNHNIPDLQAIAVDKAAIPSHIRGDLGTFRADAAVRDTDAAEFMERIRTVLRADGSESLKLRKSALDSARGMSHHRMTQTIDGIEVIGGEMILHVENATSRVLSIDAQFLSGAGLPRTPAIDGSKAIDTALKSLHAVNAKRSSEPRLAFTRTADGKGHLVWVARVGYTDRQGNEQSDDILADAITGSLVQRSPRMHHALNRRVSDWSSGTVLITEGGTTSDPAAAKAYQFTGDVYNFFWNSYGRDSYTGFGTRMQVYVHAPTSAGYHEDGAVHIGDGQLPDYGNFANGRDIVAHEWTHGVSEYEANFSYTGEPGMLNEMMSDVFGAAVEASITGITANTWKFGEDVYTPATPGDAIRYMYNPTLDGESQDYYPELNPQSHSAHLGAGIGDLAFYLMVNGGTHPRGKTTVVVNGIGMSTAARIYYLALRDYLLGLDGYIAMAEKTARVAQEQYGAGSVEHMSVCRAWNAVGVPNSSTYCP